MSPWTYVNSEDHSRDEWSAWSVFKENDDETLLILKTNSSKYPLLKKLIKEKHSYEVPCILKIPIDDGNKEYLKWIDDSLI